MVERPYQDREWLYEKYVEEELTGAEIAKAAGCARTTVYDWLDRHEIDRERGEGYRVSTPEKYRDKCWLQKKYHDEELSTSEIGKLCDCHKQTIKLWLEKHGIEKRSKSEAAKIRAKKHPHTHLSKEDIQKAGNWWNTATKEERDEFREWLSNERMGENNPMADVTGEDHPNYKENPTPQRFYQSTRWRETREETLERDNHKCQVCGADENLDVHHIQPVSAGGPRFELNNLVTLCDSHHKEWEGLYLRPDTRGGE